MRSLLVRLINKTLNRLPLFKIQAFKTRQPDNTFFTNFLKSNLPSTMSDPERTTKRPKLDDEVDRSSADVPARRKQKNVRKQGSRRDRVGTRDVRSGAEGEEQLEEEEEGGEKGPRLPKKKVALFIGYCGNGYRGSQVLVDFAPSPIRFARFHQLRFYVIVILE
jgi:hypothetical protein